MPADEMAGRIITPYECLLTKSVNNIEHVESESMQGLGIVRIHLQPGADVRTAMAQLTSVAQTVIKQMPPGTAAPLILNHDVSTVPIIQLAVSGEGMSEQQLFDLAQVQVQPQLVTVPGASVPFPSGGRQRQYQVDLDPTALAAHGLSATDVAAAIAVQNQNNPSGFVKIGAFQYAVRLNSAPSTVVDLNALPVKVVDGSTIYMRDVAHVRDGSAPQTNVVHVDGKRSVSITVLKNGANSTLSIIQGVKDALPRVLAGLPAALKLTPVGDQSLFVRAAVDGVVREGVLAAALTSLMILLFLGSWRSTLIICLSIPLAVMSAVALLYLTGQTLNVMTLGGLALAVGILVDEGTVTIENINWHLEQGKPTIDAILDGAAQIVQPAFVSMLCICIVFVPMFFLPGVAGFLFVPMALAIVFAVASSFVLSRTVVPMLARFLLKPPASGTGDVHLAGGGDHALTRFQHAFEYRFERLRASYGDVLARVLERPWRFMGIFMALVIASLALTPFAGEVFFPDVDSGQLKIHVRTPAGTRIEETARTFAAIEQRISTLLTDPITSITDNIGLPVSSINATYDNSGTVGPQDGDILITLGDGHRATAELTALLREALPREFAGVQFAFLPADITSQILNAGAPAPIHVLVRGKKLPANEAFARKMMHALRAVPGLVDLRIQEPAGYPQLNVDVDRSRVAQYGMTEQDVTGSVASLLAGTIQTAPVYLLNPDNGVSYPVVAQATDYAFPLLDALAQVPVASATGDTAILGGLGRVYRGNSRSVVSHYDIQPAINIYGAVQGRDLGAVARDVQVVIDDTGKQAPKGSTVSLTGQATVMNTAFHGLGWGVVGAIVLIYLLVMVNFQSLMDPLVIIAGLPAAVAGVVWTLFLTGTPWSVPALTGVLMCMGLATANSVLVISFAREQLALHGDAVRAALEAGTVRFRPVLMTALAMMLGMLPMALGLGEGAEQNAPLGRAVIGGLLAATAATLLLVPAVFAVVHRRSRADAASIQDASHV
ncbi:efflux RND transporter permease subunit [Luteibacter sp.]|uniref:efflux RND transporter permease subunit n=1 Tax=Luteibacter sp. TaxID=1886636 RepID=UPI0031B68082